MARRLFRRPKVSPILMMMFEDASPSELSSPRRAMPVWIFPLTKCIALLIALGVFLYFFSAISTVLLGLLAACILSCTLQPLLRYLPSPRGLSAVVLGLATLALVGGIVFAVSLPLANPIKERLRDWPRIQTQINEFLQVWNTRLNIQTDKPLTIQEILGSAGNFFAGGGGSILFSRGVDLVLGVFISLALVIFGSIFLLAEPAETILGPAMRLLTPSNQNSARAMFTNLGPRYRSWVIGTILGMFIVFVASLLGYGMIGVSAAVPLALLAGVAEIAPTVGPATACIIAALFAGATQGGGKAMGVLVVYGIIQAFEAYLILPMIMRGAVKMHPAVTLFSVVLWGKIFGVPGLMLAIPLNLTIWSFLEHFYIRPRERARAEAALVLMPQQVATEVLVASGISR